MCFPPASWRFPSRILGDARRGFTLIEILVSMAILAMLLTFVAQLLSATQKTATLDRQRMDADSEARMIFDRMALDFASMIKRDDVDVAITNQAGNDAMYFFSEAPGYFTPSTSTPQNSVSLVGYRVVAGAPSGTETPKLQLERLSKGLSWDQNTPGSPVFLAFPLTVSGAVTPTPTPAAASTIAGAFPAATADGSTDADYQSLGSQVFRLEFTLQARNDVVDRYTGAKIAGQGQFFQLQPGQAIKPSDIAAVVVSLGILDRTSRVIATGDLAQAANGLPDPSTTTLTATPPVLPGNSWQSKINVGSFAGASGMPLKAASAARVYERSFYLSSK